MSMLDQQHQTWQDQAYLRRSFTRWSKMQRRAARLDKFYVEVFKEPNEENQTTPLQLYYEIYSTGYMPRNWLKSTFITLSKKANGNSCIESWLISLMSRDLKIFLRIIHNSIWRKIDQDISETQFGFWNGFGTRKALSSLYLPYWLRENPWLCQTRKTSWNVQKNKHRRKRHPHNYEALLELA